MKKKVETSSGARLPVETALEALAWAVSDGQAGKLVEELHANRRSRQRRRIAVTTGAALVLLLGGFVWNARRRAPPATATLPASVVVSAPARQILSDGSVVDFKDGATLSVEFTPSVRRVVLQRGEAHFQVTKNRARPFVVLAGGVEFRAVGTAFSVQLGAQAVEVLVTEGRVAVDKPASAATPPAGQPIAPATSLALVDAGNRVVVPFGTQATNLPVIDVSSAEQNRRLLWRVPRLEFSGTSLSDAVSLFNRYGNLHLALDPSLGQLRMSGTLRADDVGSLLLLLKNEFEIEGIRQGDQGIFLRRP